MRAIIGNNLFFVSLKECKGPTLIATPVEPAQPLLQGIVEMHSKADIWRGDGIIKFQDKLLLVVEFPAACISAQLCNCLLLHTDS